MVVLSQFLSGAVRLCGTTSTLSLRTVLLTLLLPDMAALADPGGQLRA